MRRPALLLLLAFTTTSCASAKEARARQAAEREAAYQRMRTETDELMAARAAEEAAAAAAAAAAGTAAPPAPPPAPKPKRRLPATMLSQDLADAISSSARWQGLSGASVMAGGVAGAVGVAYAASDDFERGILLMGGAALSFALAIAFDAAGDTYLKPYVPPKPDGTR